MAASALTARESRDRKVFIDAAYERNPAAGRAAAVREGHATWREWSRGSAQEAPPRQAASAAAIAEAVSAALTAARTARKAFYDYPADHWVHLRTTNPIESTFATVRHRTKVTKGPGSRAAGLAMAFKLIQAAQDRWPMVNAPHLVALVRAGATFINGKLTERPGEEAQPEAA
jgi:hypothetical protein